MWDSSISSGICRLFPLGRYYEEKGFRYFLQVHECQKENRAKVKVKKWLDTPDLKKYETYIARWHGITDSVTGIHCSTSGECEGGQHGCTAEILPYSVSDGRILQ